MSLAIKEIIPLPVGNETGKYDSVTLQHNGLRSVQRQWEVTGGSPQSAEWLNDAAKSLFDDYGTKDGETTNTTIDKKPDSQKHVFPDCYLEEQGIKSKDPKSSSAILTKVYQEAYSVFRDIQKPLTSTDDRGRDTTQRTMVILNDSSPIDDAIGAPNPDNADQVYTKQVVEEGNAVSIVKRDYVQATASLEEIGEATMSIDDNNRHATVRTYVILNSAGQAAIDGVLGTPDSEFANQVYVSQIAQQNGVTTTVQRTFLEATDVLDQVGGDVLDKKINGLTRVTQSFVGLLAAPLGADSIGVHTIQYDGTTLYLGDLVETPTASTKTVIKIWIEAGTLSIRENSEAEGIKSVTTTFLGVEGAVVGPITLRSIGDYDGLQTISVTSMQDKNGNPLGASADPVSQFDQYVGFRYPGEVSIASDVDLVYDDRWWVDPATIFQTWNSHWYSLIPPVTSEIKARVYVFFQTDDEIVAGDLVYDGAVGLWNPNEWAKGRVDGLATNWSLSTLRQTAQDKVFNEYTTVEGGTNSVSGTADYANVPPGARLVEGQQIVPDGDFSITVSGGPGRPDGIKYVVQAPTLTPAFDDVDGNQVWKKVIIVATIPTR